LNESTTIKQPPRTTVDARRRTNEYAPTVVSPPGDTLADLLEERGMTQVELARRLGRPKKTINEIIRGKAALTAETAMQLEQALGTPASFWNAREARYREYLARLEHDAKLAEEGAELLEAVPYASAARLRWVPPTRKKGEQVRELLRFFGVSSVDAWKDVYEQPIAAAFRKARHKEVDLGALALWNRACEREAAAIEAEAFDGKAFETALHGPIRALNLEADPEHFVPKLVAACAAVGVVVVFVPAPPKCPVSGATRWLNPRRALIQLSLRHRTNGHLWFTFFHEAGHILLHGRDATFVDVEDDDRTSKQEREADAFAREVLFPKAAEDDYRHIEPIEAHVIELAKRHGLHPGIVVGRLQHDGRLPWNRMNHLKERYRWSDPE
jgi:HTH-type transcriptional regulator/antitoxin HigA